MARSPVEQGETVDEAVRAVARRLRSLPPSDPARKRVVEACQAAVVQRKEAITCARALLDSGRLEDAESIFAAVAGQHPAEAAGGAGLAQVAVQRRDWAEALERWDRVLARFGQHPNNAIWRTSCATALRFLGRSDDAEDILRNLVKQNAETPFVFLSYVQFLLANGRASEAFRVLETGPIRAADHAGVALARFRVLAHLKKFGVARREFDEVLAGSDDPDILTSLFTVVPTLFDAWERTAAWISMRTKLAKAIAEKGLRNQPAAEALRLRLHLALRDYAAFQMAMRGLRPGFNLGPLDKRLRGVGAALSAGFPDWTKIRIFGIGLPKTATTTLALALTMLDFDVADFTNPLTMELVGDDDVHLFDAFTDSPIIVGFEKYYYLFPNSKFIFTPRDFESWQESMVGQWRRHYGLNDFYETRKQMDRLDQFHHGLQFLDINHALFVNYGTLAEAYQAYEARVRGFFADKPKDRFLEFDIINGQGWPELCDFLDTPAPSRPFPWQNRDPTAPDDDD